MDDKQTQAQAQTQTQASSSKPKARGRLLMEIIAISGEFPASNISRLIPAQSYAKKVGVLTQ